MVLLRHCLAHCTLRLRWESPSRRLSSRSAARHFETEMCCACPPAFIHHTPRAQADLYQKVFWGGLWGLLFLAPLRKVLPRPWLRALIYGARPLLPCSHTFQALCSCLVRACMAARVRTGARAALPRLPAHHASW